MATFRALLVGAAMLDLHLSALSDTYPIDDECQQDDCTLGDQLDLMQRSSRLHAKADRPLGGQKSSRPVQLEEVSVHGLETVIRDAAAPSVSHEAGPSLFSAAYAKDKLFQHATGEFHDPVVSKEPITDTFKRQKCQAFYKVDGLTKSNMAHDKVSHLFRPAEEIDESTLFQTQFNYYCTDGLHAEECLNLTRSESHTGRSMPPIDMKRILTWEDVAVPRDFHTRSSDVDHLNDAWCMMYAVRTPQRPVKMMTTYEHGELTGQSFLDTHSLAMPAIWKVASTSLTAMLANGHPHHTNPHDENKAWCSLQSRMPQCEKYTSFVDEARNTKVKAAMVRSPLDRFMGSVYEHGQWELCDGKVCDENVAAAKKLALETASAFPHQSRYCDMPTQTYFLSATDVDGEPYKWDQIVRLENFGESVQTLADASGLVLTPEVWNTSGDKKTKQMYFDAIFNDLETLCSVCKVYAQDFECLGYALPDRCTQDQCSTVGVSLEPPSP
jgi:hypothetical protein